jgi:hypothetical protein
VNFSDITLNGTLPSRFAAARSGGGGQQLSDHDKILRNSDNVFALVILTRVGADDQDFIAGLVIAGE